jgi:colanic acid/amylovoran biosynthesis glycosyltransferase
MRIGIVLGKFPVLSEQFLLTQISGLIDEGHEVRIFANEKPTDSRAVQPLVEEYDLLSRTRYLRMPTTKAARFFSLAFVVAPWALFRPNTLKIIIRTAKQYPHISLLRLLYSAYRFGQERFDILHCHFAHNGFTAGLLKQLGVAPALVVSFHGHDVNSYVRRYGKDVYRPLIPLTDATTANTRFTKEKASYCGFPPDRVGIVPEGLRVEDFPVRNHLPEKGRFVVLTVGRFVEKKGHKYVCSS